MAPATQSRLAATAVRVAASPEWTEIRAAWVVHRVAGRDRRATERALIEVARLNAASPSPALARAMDILAAVLDDLGR